MIHVLGILARKKHGKSTAARYLVEQYDAKVVSFATYLKRGLQRALEFTDAQVYGTQEEKEAIDPRYGKSARFFMERIGTELLRHEFGNLIHVLRLFEDLNRWDEESDYDQLYVIDDMRFPSEAAFVAESELFMGANIKLVADDIPVPPNEHESEYSIDLVDPVHIHATIHAPHSAGLDSLYEQLDAYLTSGYIGQAFRRVLIEGAARARAKKVA